MFGEAPKSDENLPTQDGRRGDEQTGGETRTREGYVSGKGA